MTVVNYTPEQWQAAFERADDRALEYEARARAANARVAELEAALQNALLGLTRAREREAEQDATDESMGITLALNRHINAVQAALKGESAK